MKKNQNTKSEDHNQLNSPNFQKNLIMISILIMISTPMKYLIMNIVTSSILLILKLFDAIHKVESYKIKKE